MIKFFSILALLSSSLLFARFTSVDPKREFVNSYNYTSNNPVNFIDPDGHQVTVHRHVRNGKRDIVTIHMYAKIIDNTNGSGLTKRQLRSVKRQLKRQFRQSFKGEGQSIKFRGRLHISVASREDQVRPAHHVFRIIEPGTIPGTQNLPRRERESIVGAAIPGQKIIWLNNRILGPTPATTGPHANTGRSETGRATVERTGAHEAGHSMGLPHPPQAAVPGNLMHQTRRPNAGLNITEQQVLEIEQQYQQNRLNGPRQK